MKEYLNKISGFFNRLCDMDYKELCQSFRKFGVVLREHLFVVIMAGTVLLVAIVSLIVAVDRVEIAVDGTSITESTLKSNIAAVLDEAHIYLGEGDSVSPSLDTEISEGMKIEITRAFVVLLKTKDGLREIRTTALPVAQVLANAGIELNEEDKVTPSREEIVQKGDRIKIVKVTSEIITRQVTLKPGVEYQNDKNLDSGKQKVVREGKDGLSERKIKIVYEDGREKKRFNMGDNIIKKQINRIIAVGIRPVIRVLETSRGTYRYKDMRVMEATAYSPGPESCGKYAKYGVTYTGKKAGFGLVAVDPKVIPLRSKLYIEGYGYAEAADIGAAIKGNRIDLCYDTYREAIMFGRKKIKVYILSE